MSASSKIYDFETLQEALADSTAVNRRHFFTFLLFEIYILVTIASTTDLQLLLPKSMVKLPIINVELPLLGFYVAAPLVMLAFHFNLLFHMVHHAKKLFAWNWAANQEELKTKTENKIPGQKATRLPPFLLNYPVLYKPDAANRKFLDFSAQALLYYFPLLVLLFMQIRFADYHSRLITLWHFCALLIDLLLLNYYWRQVTHHSESADSPGEAGTKEGVAPATESDSISLKEFFTIFRATKQTGEAGSQTNQNNELKNGIHNFILKFFLYALPPLLFYHVTIDIVLASSQKTAQLIYVLWLTSWFLAAFSERPPQKSYFTKLFVYMGQILVLYPFVKLTQQSIHIIKNRKWKNLFSTTQNSNRMVLFILPTAAFFLTVIFALPFIINTIKHQQESQKLTQTLRAWIPAIEVTGQTIVSEGPSDTIKQHFLSEINRQLNTQNETYRTKELWRYYKGVNLSNRDLSFASFERSNLYSLICIECNLFNANLYNAHLEGANLSYAHMESAYLHKTHLEGADLSYAHLESADLGEETHLESANLEEAHLENANLFGTHLEGADLSKTRMENAHIALAHLESADLSYAHMEGVNLNEAHLEGADMERVHLEGADMENANLEGTNLQAIHLVGANMEGASLEGSLLYEAHLEGTDLNQTYVKNILYAKPEKSTSLDDPPEFDRYQELAQNMNSYQAEAFLRRIENITSKQQTAQQRQLQSAHTTAGFIRARRKLACRQKENGQWDTMTPYGILRQYKIKNIPDLQTRQKAKKLSEAGLKNVPKNIFSDKKMRKKFLNQARSDFIWHIQNNCPEVFDQVEW